MKKLLTLFALLGAMFFAQQARAASYDVWVAGTQVTDNNKNNLTGTTSKGSIQGGTITYNSTTRELNIPSGVTITASGAHGIEIKNDNIAIKINGNVTIRSNQCGIRMSKDDGNNTLDIYGNNTSSNTSASKLTIYAGSNYSGLHISKKGSAEISNIYFFASKSNGAKYGIDGSNGNNERLTIRGNSIVELNGQSYAMANLYALTCFESLEFSNANSSAWTAIFKKGGGCNSYSASEAESNYCYIRKATNYYFYVGGFEVNELNASYIGTKLKVNGVLTTAANTVTYNHSSKTLSLNGATLTTNTNGVYNVNNDGLVIQCTGTNNITTTAASGTDTGGLYFYANTTIKGTGTLNVTAGSTYGVLVRGSSTTTFSGGLTATIKGTNAVRGYYNNNATSNPNHNTQDNKVVFNNVNVTMTATNGDVCSTFGGGIEVTNCDVVTTGMHVRGPASISNGRPGYAIGSISGSSWIAANNNTVVIKNGGTNYPVSIAGRRLNSNNYQNITWPGVSGKVTYNVTNKNLTLTDVTINTSNSIIGIDIYSGFNILYVNGNNKIVSDGSGIYINNANTAPHIWGSGTLDINSSKAGIRMSQSTQTLYISCGRLIAKGFDYGIDGGNGTLELNGTKSYDSDYTFTGTNIGSMVNLGLARYGIDFCSSHGGTGTEGASYHSDKKAVCYNGGEIAKGTIHFDIPTEYYDLCIANMDINDCNCNYVGSPDITAGGRYAVRYVPSEKTLYLNGATISHSSSISNLSTVENLTIKVTSASTLETEGNRTVLDLGKNTTITGSGKLTLKSSTYAANIELTDASTLTFKDANVEIGGGINGVSDAKGKVVITNSEVAVRDNFMDIASVTPARAGESSGGTYLLSPQGGYFDASAGYVKSASGDHASRIVYGKATSYGLAIDGTAVTNINYADPTGDGSFSYYPNTKTLNVKKSYTAKSSANLIYNDTVDGLIINFAANATLTTTVNVIKTAKSATIKRSNSSIKVTLNGGTNNSYVGLWLSGAGTLTIDNMDLTINSGNGIHGNSTGSALDIKKSDITINAKYSSCISNFGSSSISECGPIVPEGARVIDGRAVDDNGNVLANTTLIISQQYKPVSYGLTIDGTAVTNINRTDPTGDGSFSYDPNSKTLTVKKSYTAKSSDAIIRNPSEGGVEDLVINFTGSYTLMSPSSSCIVTYQNTTIKSSSYSNTITLENNSDSGDGIGVYGKGKTLTLDNVKMNITTPYGIYASQTNNSKLVIKNCELTVTSTKNNRCIGNFAGGVELTDCGIYSPQGGKFSSDGAAVERSGAVITSTLVINQQGGMPFSYGLSIDGTEVTEDNNTDPTGDGSFSYDPIRKRLIVKKSYTGTTTSNIIDNKAKGVEDLVIYFTGSHTLKSPTASCIRTYKNTTILSSNPDNIITLQSSSIADDGIGEYGEGKTLTLDNVKMVINAPFGLYSAWGNNKLIIKKCDLTVTSTMGKNCISTFDGGVELSECGIETPEGGWFSSDGIAVDNNGTITTTTVIIKPQGTGIEAVVADDFDGTEVEGVDNAEGIFDLNGRRLNELQRGVNIVRRRDGSTVKVVKK